MSSVKKIFRRKSKSKTDEDAVYAKERKARRSEKKQLFRGIADSPERAIRSQMQGLLSGDSPEDDKLLRQPLSFNSPTSRGRTSYGSQNGTATSQGTSAFGAKRITKFMSTVKIQVELDDTWARLSLKYSASIDDIKRLNNLYSSDTIHSRTQLLIPVNEENKELLKDLPKNEPVSPKKEDAVEEPPKPNFGSDFPEENASSNSNGGTAAAKSFLAKFDQDFKQNKKDLIATTKMNSLELSPSAKSFSKKEVPTSNARIGSGIKGDTTHMSYQQQ